jgi:single stranded DNA-binding protein
MLASILIAAEHMPADAAINASGVTVSVAIGSGSDPKLLTTGTGKSFTRFRLAVPGMHKDEKNDTLWLTVLVWREDLAKTAAEILKKGALVLVSGRLAERTYTDTDNVLRRDLELSADKIELLASPKQELNGESAPAVTQQTAAAQ